MNQFPYKNFCRRSLPHIQPEGATIFVAFRLVNSLPKEVVEKLKAEREEAEKKIEQIADSLPYKEPNRTRIAKHAENAEKNTKICVNPRPSAFSASHFPKCTVENPLSKIMRSFKLHTALEANKILGRDGAFWQHENYDHYVRDEGELERIIRYVIYNPVKAGLVDDWKKWKWTYCKYNL